MSHADLHARIAELERQTRRFRALLTLGVVVALAVPLLAWRAGTPEILRVRGVIIVDEAGRERVVLGAPIPDPKEGKRIAAATGLAINDTLGHERFGLSLFPDGRVVMGFDAPAGVGDDRNRERISIVADQRGGGFIRFLDGETRARAFLGLGDGGAVSLEMLDWGKDSIRVRQVGQSRDSTYVVPR
ncbi:MAG TPA: hypothetical protein VFN90_03690 [Gemmatimonadales bacterium]|nr:hypothetical protein [Gemmatimonadales bacterium]